MVNSKLIVSFQTRDQLLEAKEGEEEEEEEEEEVSTRREPTFKGKDRNEEYGCTIRLKNVTCFILS